MRDATLTHGAFTASIDRKCAMQDRKQRHAMCRFCCLHMELVRHAALRTRAADLRNSASGLN